MPRRNVNVKGEVIRVLMQERKLTWSKLLKHTGVSSGALSPHLKDLINWDHVEREIDDTTRPVTTYYKLTPEAWRRQRLWVKEWDEEMLKTQNFLNFITPLSIEEKRKLRTLLEKFIKLEEFEQKQRERTAIIEDTKDGCVLRNRKTGQIVAVLHYGFPENQKKKRKYAHG